MQRDVARMTGIGGIEEVAMLGEFFADLVMQYLTGLEARDGHIRER